MNEEKTVSGAQEVAIPDGAADTRDEDLSLSTENMPAKAYPVEEESHHDGQSYMTTLYNHKTHQFDREQAEKLVQIGLYSEPHLKRLRYLARLSGEEGVKELLNKLITDGEQRFATDIQSKISDPELAHRIAESELSRLREDAPSDDLEQNLAQSRDALNRRLAGEFVELQSEFSQVDSFASLPVEVKQQAAEEGVPLKYAYALYACRQQALISAAKEQQEAASSAATHSLKSEASDGTSPEMANVYKALWGQY